MKDKLDKTIDKMASKEGITKDNFIKDCKDCSLIINNNEYNNALEFICSNGIDTVEKDQNLYTKSRWTNFQKDTYCIVDIETNGSSPKNSQIIEIGAIKYQNNEIVDKFNSFVYCDFIPEYIEKITHISKNDLKNAPKIRNVLGDFRDFLSNCVFVAHNVNFDYNFISQSLEKYGHQQLLNRKLCTINLAKKTIQSEKYGLSYLKEKLNINIGDHHRAYADALSALMILKTSLNNIPQEIETTEDLIFFSNPNKKKKKKKIQ